MGSTVPPKDSSVEKSVSNVLNQQISKKGVREIYTRDEKKAFKRDSVWEDHLLVNATRDQPLGSQRDPSEGLCGIVRE